MTISKRSTTRWTATVAACLLVAGSQLDGGPSAHAQDANATSPYTCQFPSGPQQVNVAITGTFPDSTNAGSSVQPGPITAAVTLHQAALGELTALGASKVGGTAQLATTVTENGTSSTVPWPQLSASSAAIPSSGDVTLDFSGGVPSSPGSSGNVAFTAGQLSLALTPQKADGSATSPASLAVSCTPANGQTFALATVTGSSTTNAASPVKPQGTVPDHCLDMYYKKQKKIPYGGCVYFDGFSNVTKLGAATILNAGSRLTDGTYQAPVLASAVYQGYPDPSVINQSIKVTFALVAPLKVSSTFLSFGFMPTTATIEMDQVGDGTEITQPYPIPGNTYTQVSGDMKVTIRITDVYVNGAPLIVGDHCETSTPADIVLHDAHDFVGSPTKGGTLESNFTIPPFHGCGTTENLNPLFNAEISGVSNFMKIRQGVLCPGHASSPACPPVLPELER